MEGREAELTDSVADRLRRLVTEEDSKPAILGRRFRTDGRSELSSVLSWQEACESLRSLEGKFQRGQIVIIHLGCTTLGPVHYTLLLLYSCLHFCYHF